MAESSLELLESLACLAKSKGTVTAAWKDDKFLTPFLKNYPLPYSLEDKSEDDVALNAVEKTPALQELWKGVQ